MAAAKQAAKRQKICTWSDLPTDLVVSVLARLSTVDHIRFGAVCAAWHSVWKQRLCHPAPPRVPWLMMSSAGPHDDDDGIADTRSFFDLATGKTYTMSLPELRGRHCLGTSEDGGWVFHVGDDYELGLLHLATRRSLPLPPLSTVVQNVERERRRFPSWLQRNRSNLTHLLRYLLPKAVVIASLDGSPGRGRTPPLVVFVHGANVGRVSVCRPGDGAWTALEAESRINDVVLHKGRLCAVDLRGNAIAWHPCDPSSSPVAWSKPEPLGPAMNHPGFNRKYLVSDGGELWQVWRDVQFIDGSDTYEPVKYQTLAVRAFKLDPAGHRWSEVKSLDGRVFFLGNNYPVVRSSAAAAAARKNCIYFTDDSLTQQFRSDRLDIGVYSLEDGSWVPLPLPAGAKYPTPIWATPSLSITS